MVMETILLLVLVTANYLCSNGERSSRFDELYASGVKAYNEERWSSTVLDMQAALSDYKNVTAARENCFTDCKDVSARPPPPPDYADDSELRFYHSLTQQAVCREKCKEQKIGNREGVTNSNLEEGLKIGDVHNYIQLSLFNEDKLQEGARHAATHYYLSPREPIAQSNIEFYASRNDISEADRQPLSNMPYRDLYAKGQQLYNKNEFGEMIDKFEASLKEFYVELEKCRTLCEGPIQFSDSKILSDTISSLYLSVLECKQSCPDTLGEFRRDEYSNFFGSFFHYLQFGYYKTDRLQEAVKALTTHRRIEPKNEVARMNAVYYQQLPGISQKDFIEREDARPILDKLEEESKLLNIFQRLVQETSEEDVGQEMLDDVKLLEEDFTNFPIDVQRQAEEQTEEQSEEREESTNKNFVIVESPLNHNGVERIVVDGILTEQQCEGILELTESCKEGDGYPTKSPHTSNEKFEGITVLGAAKAAVRKQANHTQVNMYLQASKMVQQILQEQFDLKKYLHFTFTHLVCRTAKDGLQHNREDMSHPVHADNCILNSTAGKCFKEPPAFTWRDYSAILYLNDDIEGGEFFFAHSPKDLSPQHHVKPKCGRMVGFSAGEENLHGVKAVTKGRRCAVALWFTFDPNYLETTFFEAETLLLGISG